MHNDAMIAFVKRWRELKKRRLDLDYERSVLASDIRAEFGPGNAGDKRFSVWCSEELKIDSVEISELLARAVAINSVHGNEKTWKTVGGFRQLRHTVDLPRTERTSVIGEAVNTGKAITTVIRERGGPRDHSSSISPLRDARILADYIRATVKDPPERIKKILKHYPKRTTA